MKKSLPALCLFALIIRCLSACQNPPSSQTAGDRAALAAGQSPFTGFWEWPQSSDTSSFHLEIFEYRDSLEGSYCAVADNGDKIDCGESGELAFKLPKPQGRTFETWLQTYFMGDTGRVRIVLKGTDTLLWELTEPPKGEHYALEKAVLLRSAKAEEE